MSIQIHQININYRLLCIFLIIIVTSCSNKSDGIVPDTAKVEPVKKPLPTLSHKKGACITTNKDGWSSKVSALNVYWHYS